MYGAQNTGVGTECSIHAVFCLYKHVEFVRILAGLNGNFLQPCDKSMGRSAKRKGDRNIVTVCEFSQNIGDDLLRFLSNS
jgi:hypothetical protein